MNTQEQNLELRAQSKDTGIPPKELRRMCINAGLELLKKGELKVTSPKPRREQQRLTA